MTPRNPFSHAVAPRKRFGVSAASLLLSALMAGSGLAQDARDANPLAGGIEEMVTMPGGAWRAARVGRGAGADDRVYFVSENGRYVVRGEAYDLWEGARLRDFEAVRASTRSIKLSGLGLIWDDLDPITFGDGEEDVIVFADPRCPACEELIARLLPLSDSYRIVVLQVPLLGDASGKLVKAAHCAVDREAVRTAIVTATPMGELEQRPECDAQPILRRLATAQMIGVRGVPFMIHGRDGRFTEGAPADLAAWLEVR